MFKRSLPILLAAILLVTGCSPKQKPLDEAASKSVISESQSETSASASPTQPSESSSTPQALSETDELGLPKMTAENQTYYDKYLKPFYAAYPLFAYSFDENNWEFVEPARIYACIAKPAETKGVAQEEVEALIAQWFPMNAQQARAQSSIHEYDAQKGVYTPMTIEGITPDTSCGVVTDSKLADGILTLTCDWYQTVYPGTAGSYEKRATSVTTIRIDADDKWFYLSNTSTLKKDAK